MQVNVWHALPDGDVVWNKLCLKSDFHRVERMSHESCRDTGAYAWDYIDGYRTESVERTAFLVTLFLALLSIIHGVLNIEYSLLTGGDLVCWSNFTYGLH